MELPRRWTYQVVECTCRGRAKSERSARGKGGCASARTSPLAATTWGAVG